jgi:ketosteroid isomerase-like protein
MKIASRGLVFLVMVSAVFTIACSSEKPADVVFDDRAKLLNTEQQNQLRGVQQKYRDGCKSALAIITVTEIPRPEPGAFVDDEFRKLLWPEWVESDTPKALIFYSRKPELLQIRLANRWLGIEDQIKLQDTINNRTKSLIEQGQSNTAIMQAASLLNDDCPQPIAQGWIKNIVSDGLDEAKDTIQDYAFPKADWLSRWYYTLLFEPILNSFLLTLNSFDYAPWVVFVFPIVLVICSDQKSLSFLIHKPMHIMLKLWNWISPNFVAKHANNIWGITSVAIGLLIKGFRWLIGLPSYAVLCLIVFWRPEDSITVQNHLYSWMPSDILSHFPIRGLTFVPYDFLAPSGLALGILYFVTSGIKQGFEIAAEIKFAAMSDEERERFGVIGKLHKEYQEQEAHTILEEWLKKVWKLILFSIVITVAPLALTLYFVVKAVYEALSELLSILLTKLKMKVPTIIRYVPHIAVFALLIIAYSQLSVRAPISVSASSNNPAVRDISNALQQWAASVKARDINAHMSFYTDPLDTYFMKRRYSANKVRAEISTAFSRYSMLDVQISSMNVSVEASGEKATATFTKVWNFKGEKTFSGSVQQKAWLVKQGERWLITGIKDL